MIIIKDLIDISFIPYNRYGETINNIFWHNINYDDNNGIGTYILKFNSEAKTRFHKHLGEENFLVLEGEITDSSTNQTYVKGNFVNLKKNSCHFSYSKKGCYLLVFSQGHISRL